MRKMYIHVLENVSDSVYNFPEWRGFRIYNLYLYGSLRENCREIKKEVFSL